MDIKRDEFSKPNPAEKEERKAPAQQRKKVGESKLESIIRHRHERTLIIIKPEHVHLADEILNELDRYGERVKTVHLEAVPLEIIERHYAIHKGQVFYPWLITQFAGKPVVLAVYEGVDIIRKMSGAIGPTDPAKAPKDTIRGRYGDDSMERSMAEKRATRNVIHRSATPEEAEKEIAVWRRYLFG
jgi:nucleoside-diphosphate kinase